MRALEAACRSKSAKNPFKIGVFFAKTAHFPDTFINWSEQIRVQLEPVEMEKLVKIQIRRVLRPQKLGGITSELGDFRRKGQFLFSDAP